MNHIHDPEQYRAALQTKRQHESEYVRNDRLGGGLVGQDSAPKSSPLHEAIKRLEHDIASLSESYGQLHRRLEPITAQVPVNATEKCCGQQHGVSNVVQAIQSQSERLQQLTCAIHRQIDCLEV